MLRVRGKGFVLGYIYYPFAFCFYLVSPCQGKTHFTFSISHLNSSDGQCWLELNETSQGFCFLLFQENTI